MQFTAATTTAALLAASSLPLVASAAGNGTMKASFTEYGAGDQMGSANCATTTNACGQPSSGYTAAISQKQFGVGPGAGAGPACGQCYSLTVTHDSSNHVVPAKTVKVKVNNLCPVDGNPVCNVPNQYGAEVHFDLCRDTGVADVFFTGTGMGTGSAVEVPC